MKLDEALETLKEFFLDIIGYLIPGLIFLCLCYYSLEIPYRDYIYKSYVQLQSYQTMLLLVAAYTSGYVVYSIALILDDIKYLRINPLRKFLERKTLLRNLLINRQPNDILKEIQNSYDFKASVELIKELQNRNTFASSYDYTKLSVLAIRSLVMSYIPDADKKIYTFMFRAELCNFIGTLFKIFSFIYIVSYILESYLKADLIIITSSESITIAIVLFLVSFLFFKTRARFLSITYKIPFSIFLSRKYKLT